MVAVQFAFFSISPASAGLFSPPKLPSIPSPSQNASEIEQRYNIDQGSMQDQGQNLNVSSAKKVTPEVSIFFTPSDPKEGELLAARAFPTYFSGDSAKLYYTWYLQRVDCKPGSPPTPQCDLDSNGRLDHNDWKIAAHRILAGNDFDFSAASYAADTDDDGYQARFGGDTKVNVPNHCYFQDKTDGTSYELVEVAEDIRWGCPAGRQPVCMVSSTVIDAGSINLSAGGGAASGGSSSSGSAGGGSASGGSVATSASTFTWTGADDYVSGTPYCQSSGVAACSTGTPCCVTNPATAALCDVALNSCARPGGTVGTGGWWSDEGSTIAAPNPVCTHLFPRAPGFTAGDGSFSANEERFWQTDPNDPDTADNGNKDEANIVGLGRDSFTWNYLPGDRIGVVIEGTSMINTKHNDSSGMIMWAFSKNNCPLMGSTGQYTKTIKGYEVVFPTVEMDLNDCLERNLVDPTEGGQATNLEMTVTASPEDVINDVTTRGDGDLLEVNATINNGAQALQAVYYEWRVQLSSDGTANPVSGWVNITTDLMSLPGGRKLLSQIKGNGVNKVNLNMNLQSADVFGARPLSSYLASSIGYLRFQVDAIENFGASGATRRGRSNIVVKFNASQDKIFAHTVTVAGSPAKLSIDTTGEICSGIVNPADPPEYQVSQRLDGKVCRVIQNEVIGLEVTSPDLSNFSWSINGQPLVCNSKVSATNCFDDRQGNINFFPIIGNVGDTFNITVIANRVNSTISTEKAVTISRTFKIVQPMVNIISNDQNNVWSKVLGQYVDTNGTAYTEFSKETLETYEANQVSLRAAFTPDFLATRTPPQVERFWTVDRVATGDGLTNAIGFPATKIGTAIYNVSLSAVYRPTTAIRQAMKDIWGISALDTSEIYFSSNIQVEQPDTNNITQSGTKKYYALLASYLPASVLFSLKVLFSVFLILFSSGVVFALIPNAPVPSRMRR